MDPGDTTDTTDTGTLPQSDEDAEDGAAVVAINFPDSLDCGELGAGTVTVENTGTTIWTRAEGYKLGTVDDEDPFYDSTRVYLPEGITVAPGETWTFEADIAAPDSEDTYTTDWQMVREHTHWFGEQSGADIAVTCPETWLPELDEVTWLHTDVSEWSQTATLSSVTVDNGQICLDYDMADEWPIYDYDGTEVVANPWVFIHHEGQWYGATWEWMRPSQICKSSDSVAGDHIKQSPFDAESGWKPTSGQTYWFMVSGLARLDSRNVEERSNLVSVVWP